VQFAEYIQANIQLYLMKNNTSLGPKAVASFVRGEVARSLRSRNAYQVNLLLGGVDPITGEAGLYWIDYLATMAKIPYAAHGYAQWVPFARERRMLTEDRYYCLSILDKHHHPDIDLARGMELLSMCSDELKRRLPIDFKGLHVKVVTKEGIQAQEFNDTH
jgi:20S proteasome subunit beta 4